MGTKEPAKNEVKKRINKLEIILFYILSQKFVNPY